MRLSTETQWEAMKVEVVANAIDFANQKQDLPQAILDLGGMSSSKVRTLLNQLAKGCSKYLEVGVWHGSTFISALHGNTCLGTAVDNFSQFHAQQSVFEDNCQRHLTATWKLLRKDFFSTTEEELGGPFDLYFYDGHHGREEQHKAITHAWPYLASPCILLIDDWNDFDVQRGTQTGLEEVHAIVEQQWELPSSRNGDRDQWWNGLFVAVVSKPYALRRCHRQSSKDEANTLRVIRDA